MAVLERERLSDGLGLTRSRSFADDRSIGLELSSLGHLPRERA